MEEYPMKCIERPEGCYSNDCNSGKVCGTSKEFRRIGITEDEMIGEILEVLNLAQCELRAMYKRLGYLDSNVLRTIDNLMLKYTKP